MVWPRHQGYLVAGNMAGTGIWRCKNACFFSWAQLTKVKCLAPSTWKSVTPLELSASNRVEFRTLGKNFQVNLASEGRLRQLNFIHLKKICYIVSKMLNEMTHTLQLLIHWHDQTSKGRSFQLASCLPPLSAQRTKSMVAHANQCLLGSTWQGGI